MSTRSFALSLCVLALLWVFLIRFTAGGGSEIGARGIHEAAGESAVESARSYLRSLFRRIHDSHPELADVDSRGFVTRVRSMTRALIDEEPERAERLGIQAPTPAWAHDEESWARAAIPDHADAELLEDRVGFFAESVVLATEDPFTQLIIGDEFGNFGAILRQFFPSSVGVFLEEDDAGLYLAIVMRGSGAEAAGLRAGDRVLAINGQPAAEMSLRQARRLVADGSCELRLARDATSGAIDVAVYPTEIRGMAPIGFLVTPNVAYLRFTIFTGMAGGQLLSLTRRLVDEGARAFVLDLRGNPGGAVSDAWVIADLFLDSGQLIVELEQRPDNQVDLPNRLIATSAMFGEDYPLMVLIDRSSASASELLGGALQDHRRAFLVGEPSYGKGVGQVTLAQNLRRVDDEVRTDTLALTCFRFNSPRGHNVHGQGLQPDLRVDLPPPPLEQTRLQAELVASECLIHALRDLELSDSDVAALRTVDSPLPTPITTIAAQCGIAFDRKVEQAALREVCRVVLEFRHVELAACPGSHDPVLDKALRIAAVKLR